MDQRLNMRLLLTAQGEWNIYACGVLAQRLHDLGCQVFVAHRPVAEHLLLPFTPVWKGAVLPLDPEQLAASDLTHHVEAIGIFAAPDAVAQFQRIHRLTCELTGRQPGLLFSGPSEPLSGDLLEEDLLARLGCDLLCLHGTTEVEVLEELMRHSDHPNPAHVVMGLWQLPPQASSDDSDAQPIRNLIFIEQADFPASSSNRRKLLSQLEHLARSLPDWRIIIHPEYSQTGQSKDLRDNSLARLMLTKSFKRKPELPENLMIGGAGGLPQIIANASLTVTLTSTAALAALAWGKPLLLMADYGFSSACNSQLWMGSGLTGRLSAITTEEELLEIPVVHPGWLQALGGAVENGAADLIVALQRLLKGAQA